MNKKTKGLWTYLSVDYTGTLRINISTKINLMNLKQNSGSLAADSTDKKILRHLGMLNSDEEDSPESSGDEYTYQNKNEDDKIIDRLELT